MFAESGTHVVCLDCERMAKGLEAATHWNGLQADRIKHLEAALAEWEKERLFLQDEIARLRGGTS